MYELKGAVRVNGPFRFNMNLDELFKASLAKSNTFLSSTLTIVFTKSNTSQHPCLKCTNVKEENNYRKLHSKWSEKQNKYNHNKEASKFLMWFTNLTLFSEVIDYTN